MAEEVKGVEAMTETAPASSQGVETKAPAVAPAEDPEAKYLSLKEEVEKLRRDRDNYRNAALALKGKKDLEDLDMSDPTQVNAFIQKSIEDRLLQEKESSAERVQDAYVRELAKKNREMAIALSARSTISGVAAGGGGSSVGEEPKRSFFSPDQIESLKARWRLAGIPSSKYDEMLKQAERNISQ